MRQPDPHALNFEQMRLAHALVGLEAIAMAVEAFVAIAERRDHRRDRRQFVEHAVDVNVARMHHQIDPGEDLEHPWWQMLAGFGDMSVGDQPDSHYV